jgi:hypothetical protein
MRGFRFFFISTLGGAGLEALVALSWGMMDMWYLNLISFLLPAPSVAPAVVVVVEVEDASADVVSSLTAATSAGGGAENSAGNGNGSWY